MATCVLSPPVIPVENSLGKGEVERVFLFTGQASSSLVGDRCPPKAELSTHLRARIEAEIERLIALLDTADAPVNDMEPDHDGEGEPREAWLQPATLAPPARPVQVIRPSRAQQRAAYRAIGAPVPRELRGLVGRVFA